MIRRKLALCRPPDRLTALVDTFFVLVFVCWPIGLELVSRPITIWTLIASAGGAAAVLLRRGFPALVVVLAFATTWYTSPVTGLVLIGWLSYGAGFRIRRFGHALALLVVTIALVTVLPPAGIGDFERSTLTILLVGIPGLIGRYRQQQQQLVVSGWERAAQFQSEQELLAEQVRHQERARIARDMHDSLGHDLSLIALQAGALELDAGLPEEKRKVARTLRTATTDAMDRLEDVLAVLREDSGESNENRESQDSVDNLVERAAEAGVRVRVERDSDFPELPEIVRLALYRVIQESLTNATKHAPGSEVLVRLENRDEIVTASVSNQIVVDPGTSASGGRGLIGLAERVRLAGGRLDVARSDGVFRVTAELPRDPAGIVARPREKVPAPPAVLRRLRFDFWTQVVGPIALMLVVTTAFSYYSAYRRTSGYAVDPAVFDSLRIGETRDAVNGRLQIGQESRIRYPDDRDPIAHRPGVNCYYYRQKDSLFTTSNQTYRLCFDDYHLVAKDLLP